MAVSEFDFEYPGSQTLNNGSYLPRQGSPILKIGEEANHVVTAVNAVSCGPGVCC